MSIVDLALYDILTEQELRTACPIVRSIWESKGEQWVAPTSAMDITAFCANCPDVDRIPDNCPEALPGRHQTVCVVWNPTAKTPANGCKLACPCFEEKGAEWWAAYNAWLAKQEQPHEADERCNSGEYHKADRGAPYEAGDRVKPRCIFIPAFVFLCVWAAICWVVSSLP